jgi:malic enzyme
VRAVTARWPRAVLQFEDFNIEHALPLLERYRRHHLVFNVRAHACERACARMRSHACTHMH